MLINSIGKNKCDKYFFYDINKLHLEKIKKNVKSKNFNS